MFDTQEKVLVSKQEETALLSSKGACSRLSTYWAVSLLSLRTEPASYIYGLPPCGTAPWFWFTLTLAVLLTEPKTHGHLGPVRGQGCRECQVEAADTLLTLTDHFLFGGSEGLL